MCKAPTLAMHNFHMEFKIECDVVGGGIGEVLSQGGRPIAYLSKSLSPKHLGMSISEKEKLAVVYAIQKWHPYLIGRHFKICTNHFSLKYMLDQRISTPMPQKWLSKLIYYDFEIYHRSGKKIKGAKTLSRMNESVEKATMMVISFLLAEWVEQLKQEWEQDVKIQRLIKEIQADPSSHSKYSWEYDLLKYKGRLWLGKNSLKLLYLKRHMRVDEYLKYSFYPYVLLRFLVFLY